MDKILVLSGSETTSGVLEAILQREHFLPILANSLEAALQKICTLHPDVLIIDVPLPGIAVVELCMELQMCKIDKAVIVLGDSSEEIDIVLALESGAAYYVTKPLPPRELVARVRALLRRRRANLPAVIRFGNVEVDRQRQTVTCRHKDVKMTPYEYKLLLFFLSNVDLALTRRMLLSSVWGYRHYTSTRTLDAHVGKLRSKREVDPNTPRHLVMVYGVGYRFPYVDAAVSPRLLAQA